MDSEMINKLKEQYPNISPDVLARNVTGAVGNPKMVETSNKEITTSKKANRATSGLPRETEAEFQQKVIDLLHLHGFRVAHFRPAMTKDGRYITAVAADGAGFTDLVAVGHGHCWFIELKTATGRLSNAQSEWATALLDCGMEYYLWRPSDWGNIVKVVSGN